MIQLFRLGQTVRKKYGDFVTLPTVQVDLHSSERGLPCGSLSKCGFLSGFYRPNKEQPPGAGEMLTWQMQQNEPPFTNGGAKLKPKPSCPEQRTSTPYEQSEEGNGIVAENENLYEYWSSNSGMEIKNPTDARELYENLQLEKSLNNQSSVVPSWVDRFWPELKRQSDIHFAWLAKNQDLQRIAAGPLLGLMIQRMERHMDGHDTRKYFVYSGKSSSLAGLLALFGSFDGVEPSSGSTVVMELHKFGNFHYVRVLHFHSSSGGGNAAPEVVSVRGCSEYCPFDKFKLLTTGMVPLRWQQGCAGAAHYWDDSTAAKAEPFRMAGILCCLLFMMYAY